MDSWMKHLQEWVILRVTTYSRRKKNMEGEKPGEMGGIDKRYRETVCWAFKD